MGVQRKERLLSPRGILQMPLKECLSSCFSERNLQFLMEDSYVQVPCWTFSGKAVWERGVITGIKSWEITFLIPVVSLASCVSLVKSRIPFRPINWEHWTVWFLGPLQLQGAMIQPLPLPDLPKSCTALQRWSRKPTALCAPLWMFVNIV